ncbi:MULTISPECIES: phenylalanine--tRNA ligase subunit beta [Paenalcaligenes]|uniref:Phenylalanine--tRNA ligase beta subunit n=1 Tax=Paenalcaligenes hermetiae TaxID=1157987 RepID=A0ABP9M6S6_9BURK|nr:phenylalanine--tRNA ligase subunit beta [Paenalcaligenes sp.]
MFVSESWLRTLVNPALDSDTLCHRLTMAGLEVEESVTAAPAFSGVVVAEITAIEPHPDADRLRVCQVNTGTDTVQIVCGAPNARQGLKAPLAQLGAVLPGDFKIGKAKMRGVESFGMLCSAKELGITEDSDGLLELPADAPVGTDIREYLDLDDHIIEIKMTPNRADCLSMLGVAREVAALTGDTLNLPSFEPVPVTIDDRLPVTISAPDLCGRFAGRIVKGINAAAQTPDWMVQRLERAGQRSVSVLVDISNYVMLELGRPTHVFDLAKIASGLEVRWAKAGEKLTLLSGKEVELHEQVGVIAANGVPQSLAGIMGGEDSAVDPATTQDIYIEAAFWWPEAIMGRARQFKFHSEASHRFERGVDYEHVVEHLERMTQLVLSICGGQAGPIDDQKINVPEPHQVSMRLARCRRVLGIPVTEEEVTQIFTRLGFEFTVADQVFTVTSPSYRFDLRIEEDLIEEVARIYGFERIPDQAPVAAANIVVETETHKGPHRLRAQIAALDYQEVINFSFVEEAWEKQYAGNEDPIRLLNPIASQLAVMRSSLLGGLLANIEHNARHRQSRVRVFELGKVFMRDASVKDGDLTVAGVHQPMRLAAAAWGPVYPEQWGTKTRQVDFFDVKSDIENLFGVRAAQLRFVAAEHPALHPGRSARIELDERVVGWLGELHPLWLQQLDIQTAPVLFELDAEVLMNVPMPAPQRQSRQPVVQRDLAFWLSTTVSYQDIVDTLQRTIAADTELTIVKQFRLFDVWKADAQAAEQSLAMRFWLQDSESTLEDERVEKAMHKLLVALEQAHQIRQRA